MKKLHRTMRGVALDIDALRTTYAEEPAIGNGSMNARGDIIGFGGQIVQSRDAIVEEYYRNSASVRSVKLQQDRQHMMAVPDAPLMDGNQMYAMDPNFFRRNDPVAYNMEFKTPEQIVDEAKARKLQAQQEIQRQEAEAMAAAMADFENKVAKQTLSADIEGEDAGGDDTTKRKPKKSSGE